MGRRAAVLGAVGGARARAAVHDLRGRRRARRATSRDEQVPAFRARTARPDARYDVGCLYVGRQRRARAGLGCGAFAADHAAALAALAERCDRLLLVTLPLDLGRPRAGGASSEANAIIEAAAREHGALVLDLRGFGARNLVMTDHVHPTAFGQVWIAERALDVLGRRRDRRPRAAVDADPPRRAQRLHALQGDWTYVYRRLKEQARAAGRGSGAPSCSSRFGT